MSVQEQNISLKKTIRVSAVNPFPGLRPFTIDESHLFFGREGQSDEVLQKLANNQFVAVIGTSGSGKSSLMQCGLIPILHGGFMATAGKEWNVITCRPGNKPVDNIADALFKADQSYMHATSDERHYGKNLIRSIVKSSSYGVVDAVRFIKNLHGKNTFILIDQFEELFRYRRYGKRTNTNQAAAFVNLMIDTVYQSEEPIYIALTMRSDFIGECSQFPDLTDLINTSHYLIPQMNREQQRLVIEGPIQVAQGKISQRLIQQLLNDVGDSPDQLPVLQHALMRTWDYWVQHREEESEIDVRHYNAIGTIDEALSQHADEAYEELSKEDKEVCEVLFKSMTEKGPDNIGIRRPTTPGNVARIARCEVEDVIRVVEKFRKPGRSLLMPPAGTVIDENTIVEISHESLMRIWIRLRNWVEEESDSAEMYLRISEAAAMYQIGKTGLWRPPDLQLALNWRKKQNPGREWAERYDDTFERAMVFIDTSKMAYESEQRNQELMQKKRLKKARNVALLLGSAAIICLLFFLVALINANEVEKALAEVNVQYERAEVNQQKAELRAEEALKAEAEAKEQARIAKRNQEIADSLANQARIALASARREKLRADEKAEEALFQKSNADEQRLIAQQRRKEAEDNLDLARKRYYLMTAQSVALNSTNIADAPLRALLSKTAHNFHDEYGGETYDRTLYNALYTALKALKNSNFNLLNSQNQEAVIFDLAVSPDGNRVYSAADDGRIEIFNLNQQGEVRNKYVNAKDNVALAMDPNERWLVNIINRPYDQIQVFDLQQSTQGPRLLSYHDALISSVKFAPRKKEFYTADVMGYIKAYDFKEERAIASLGEKVNDIYVHPGGRFLFAVTEKGDVYKVFIDNNREPELFKNELNPVKSIAFNQAGNRVALGFASGKVKEYNLQSGNLSNEFYGQNTTISEISYSPDDRLLATASWDHSVQIWDLKNTKNLPINLSDHKNYVRCLSFSEDGAYLYAGTEGGIKRWPVNMKRFASEICDELQRNLDRDNWKRYIGDPDEIPWEETCEGIDGIVKR